MQSSDTSSEHPRVLLVDDNEHMLVRSAAVLGSACDVVGAARNGRAALEAVRLLHPDVVVLDISMPGMTGFEVAEQLRESGEPAAVVFLTVHDEESMMRAAMDAGALGFVVKARLATDLPVAIHEALQGRRFVSRL